LLRLIAVPLPRAMIGDGLPIRPREGKQKRPRRMAGPMDKNGKV